MLLDTTAKTPWFAEQWARRFFFNLCAQLTGGELVIREGRDTTCLGSPASDGLKVEVSVSDIRTYRMLLTGGSNGAAEAFMEGYWEVSDLTSLVRLLLRNRSELDAMEGGMASLAGAAAKIWHSLNRNTKAGSRKNIAAHYDLGNEFFELFLDENLMYSSAVFETGEESLEEASLAKLERICRKLDLQPQDHLLEIGTGWGGMALYAAGRYGCKVTTTTISHEQYSATLARVKAAGLGRQINVLKQDYRDLEGQYDKVVSIEMVEAVGHHYLDGYFAQVSHLLKPDGLAVIQAITIEDSRYQQALRSVDFIKRYIFPGSFIPCVSVLTGSAAQAGLRLFNLEDIGPSYAQTLKIWHERFNQNLDQVRSQGFDERFIRMWQFYLGYCEGGFRERAISTVHMVLVKSANRREQWLA